MCVGILAKIETINPSSLFAFTRDGRDDLTDRIDFIVCLGGDGTLLYASLLFQQSVPPVMAFHLGSLGFLTPFQFDNFQEQVTNVLEGHAALTLRSRLRCIIVRKNQEEPCESSCEKNWLTQRALSNDSSNGTTAQKPATNILVMNPTVLITLDDWIQYDIGWSWFVRRNQVKTLICHVCRRRVCMQIFYLVSELNEDFDMRSSLTFNHLH